MPMRFVLFSLLAATLWSAASAAQPASPLTYDCQAYLTRVDPIPPVAAGDSDPWQCTTLTLPTSSAVHWQRNALEYCRLTTSVYDMALKAARGMAQTHRRRQWIVILDADETVIDNTLLERERDHCGGQFRNTLWESWVHAAIARDVPGAAIFTQQVHRLGGLVAIVTNRVAADDAITQGVLRRTGVWFDYEIGMADAYDKTTRWQGSVAALAVKFGGRPVPVMWLGDQVTDLAITDRRGSILRAMTQKDSGDGVGRTLFLLPNAMYGNWTGNPDR
jgi:5'-nucleotidase (lipoprotein e(P4) family)